MTNTIIILFIIVIICLFIAACTKTKEKQPVSEATEAIVVHVEFINGTNQTVVVTSDIPLEQLPDSFRIDTTLELAEKKWSVVSANPTDKTEFSKTGKLRVVLSEIQMMPPGDLLYSLPTISNDCGQAMGDVIPHEGLFQIHEDDWRQIEFVGQGYKRAIQEELADIQSIYEKEHVGVGFKRVHVRKRIPAPLSGTVITVDELRTYFPVKKSFEAVSFLRSPGFIPQSFVWITDFGSILWGVTDPDGTVLTLCLKPTTDKTKPLADALSKFTRDKKVVLVDWCRVVAVAGDIAIFEKFLNPKEE